MVQLIKGIVDTQKNNYRSIGQVSVGDDLELELEVKMNCQSIQFLNPQAELLIKKADGNRVRQTKDILYQGGKFKIKVDEQGVTYPGIVTCQLVTKEDGRVSTCLFYFNVGASLDREVLQSISKVETLEQLDEYVVQAFANLEEYEKRIIAGDETIRKLNNDMNEAEKIRDAAELERQETFKSLKENMNTAIINLESLINLSNLNEKERSEVFNSLKSNLESIKQDLINLNINISLEEEKRVQAEINRVNKALEIIGKLESTNDKVTIAEAERVIEFNNIKSELTSLKEALTTINNTANSNEEVRKTNENERVTAEQQRVTGFEKIKSDNANLRTTLTKKVDDKIVEIEANNNTFKQEINEQYDNINTKNNEFKEQMNTDFGNAKVGYDGKEYLNVVDRLNAEFDGINQRFNDSTYLEYEGTNITADNSYYGLTKEMSIKGRTLQNLCPSGYTINWQHTGTWLSTFLYDNSVKLSNGTLVDIKPNTKYTIIINVTQNTSNIDVLLNNFDKPNSLIYKHLIIPKGTTGLLKYVVTTIEDFSILERRIFLRAQSCGATEGVTIVSNIIVLEGDYTNTPLDELPFGEGIYSAGESEDNLIKVKSCGKNLLNLEDSVALYPDGSTRLLRTTTGVRSYIMKCKATTKYKISQVSGTCNRYQTVGVNEYPKVGSSYDLLGTSYDVLIQTGNNHKYLLFYFTNDIESYGSDFVIQVEEKESSTSYEPYQESTQELQLTEPLRSLPNGVCDEIREDGTEVRRIGKVVLDGSFDFYAVNTSVENKCRWMMYRNPNVKNINVDFVSTICSHFNSVSALDTWSCTKEGVAQNNGSNCIYLFLERYSSTLDTSTNKHLLKTELQANPVTLYYELTEPVITKHNLNINLKTFEGTTHITSDNYLLPTLSCKVPSNVQAIIQTLRLDNEELTQELESTNLELEEKTTQLEKMDTDLVATTWDMDYRLCEWEWYLEDMTSETMSLSLNIEENENTRNVKGGNSNMALSRYEQAKIMIVGGAYNKETLTRQLTTYLNRGYVSQEEYDELIALMEAKDLVMEEVQA